VLVRFFAVVLKGLACGVAGRQGSHSPSMIASLGYEMPKPPYLLMAVTFGGVVMLNAYLQTMDSYAMSLVREISGSWFAGTPDPVCRKPHCVQY